MDSGSLRFTIAVPAYNEETSILQLLGQVKKYTSHRDDVEIHAANSILEIEGCIAVGIKMYEQVGHSKDTLNKLLDYLKEPTTLTIKGNLL